MRLVFAGTPDVAVPALRRLLADPRHEVVAVLTQPDRPAGRRRHVQRGAVAAVADAEGIEVLQPHRPGDPEALARLREIAPECVAVVAYGCLVPRAALDIPRHGWVNLHFSLLPAYRGAAPVQAAIAAGDDVTGATTFLLEEGLDTGPVLGTITEPIRPTDTAGELLERLAEAGAGLLAATMTAIADGEVSAVPQPEEGVSHVGKVTPEDARVRWDLPAHVVDRRLRAVTPAPGGWTMLGDDRIKLGPVTVCPEDEDADCSEAVPGTLAVSKHHVDVHTGGGRVRLGRVTASGRKPQDAAEWARGARLASPEGVQQEVRFQ